MSVYDENKSIFAQISRVIGNDRRARAWQYMKEKQALGHNVTYDQAMKIVLRRDRVLMKKM